jgi:hypothetical protein
MLNARALALATTLGAVLQVAMVVAGHSNKSIAGLFAVGGMGLSLMAGLLYAMWARGSTTSSLVLGGLIAGALCALIGIFVSFMLGDVPPSLLALGTVSSAVTGALGGWLGRFLFRAAGMVTTLILLAGVPFDARAQAVGSVDIVQDRTPIVTELVIAASTKAVWDAWVPFPMPSGRCGWSCTSNPSARPAHVSASSGRAFVMTPSR